MMRRAFNNVKSTSITANSDNSKPKIKLFREGKIQLKSWWRQLKIPIVKPSNSNSSTTRSATSSHTTLDWRSLSPDRPPLPFFLPDNSSPTSSSNSIVHQDYNNRSVHKSSSSSSSSSSTSNISINTNNIPIITTTSPTTLDTLDLTRNNNNINTNINNNKSIRTNTDERNYQPLCPILEESETMVTDSSVSNVINSSSSRLSPGSLMQEEEGRISSESAGSSSINTEHRNLEKQPMSKSSIVVTDDEDTQSVSSFHPPPIASATTNTEDTTSSLAATATQKTPSDKYMSDEFVGDEERCRRKFAKMVLAANKFKNKQEKDSRPTHMALLFDVHGNIDMMRMVRQGKSEYHKFCGNSQYVPPELSINIEYNSDLADIWVLGIFLYRMLVGKYPFNAENDQQLFKKMLHGNFSIPQELSEDAKDLLKRMLAPDMTRASLDLVIYHPWIKAYRPLLLDQYYSTSKATSSLINHTTAKNEYFNNNSPTPQQQRNTTMRTNSVHNSTTTYSTATSNNNQSKRAQSYNTATTTDTKKPASSKNGKKFIRKAIMLLVQGPFPPPKKPYRDLSHLGTRESVFARQQQKV